MTRANVEAKATRLVVEGKVHLNDYRLGDEGEVVYARGMVQSGSEPGTSYAVEVTPGGNRCTCPYGANRLLAADSHSHDIALRIGAQIDHERSTL